MPSRSSAPPASARDGAEIILVQDKEFNAFVASGRRMIIYTGTLAQAATPNEVIGVIAHETGHLAGGHVEALHNEIARAQAIGAIIGLIGVAGIAAGAAAGSTTGSQAGAAATTMGPGVAARTLLSYRRAQELAADRAALTYLNASGQSARGMLETFRRFADQQLFSAQYADPYAQSHPMARDRLEQLERAALESPNYDVMDRPEMQLRHDMMRAKLSGFTDSPEHGRAALSALRRSRCRRNMPAPSSLRAPAAYARRVRAIDDLIARSPSYPYFHELKGPDAARGRPGERGDRRRCSRPCRSRPTPG